jgi:hypothetical protein
MFHPLKKKVVVAYDQAVMQELLEEGYAIPFYLNIRKMDFSTPK